MKQKPHVVVVGGSFAGLCTARHLKNHADVTLIEPKNYFEYTPGILHVLAGSKAHLDIISCIEAVSGGSKVICGTFEGLEPNENTAIVRPRLQSQLGESTDSIALKYDALVLCTGRNYIAPIRPSEAAYTFETRIEELQNYTKSLDASGRIVVIGGGLVGVELAAELAVRVPKQLSSKRDVILISKSTLLGTLPPAAGGLAASWLKRQKNVSVVLNDEISAVQEVKQTTFRAESELTVPKGCYEVTTKGGQQFSDVEMIIDCTNGALKLGNAIDHPVSTMSVKRNVYPFNKNGYVTVNRHLQSVSFDNIFAAGDIIEFSEGSENGFACDSAGTGFYGNKLACSPVRNAHLAESQAELLATNVLRLLKSAKDKPLKLLSYPQDVFYSAPLSPLLACVSLGPNNGIIVFNNFVLGGVFFGLLGGLVKFIIERSKVAEIRDKAWGRAFWAFGHVVVNSIHSSAVRIRSFISSLRSKKGGTLLQITIATALAFLGRLFFLFKGWGAHAR